MAVGDDLAVSVQLTEAVRELAERNEPGTVDVRDRMLVPVAHVDPLSLKGATVRLRGWVRFDARPMIDVTHPEQIELLNHP